MAKKIKPAVPAGDVAEGKERTSVYLKADTIKRIKLISVFDERSLTDVMEIALESYIKNWEGENGPLPKKPVQ